MQYLPDILSPAAKPEKLLRRVLLIGAAAIVLITLLAGFGIYRIYSAHVVRDTEDDAVSIAQSLFQQEMEVLVRTAGDGTLVLGLREEDVGEFDGRMRENLRSFSILKIKIFAADGTVIYSTDRSIIGRVDSGNARLANALRGYNDSRLEKKEKVLDLMDEARFSVDVVETYVPIVVGGRVAGSFEIYMDVTRDRGHLMEIVFSSILILLLVLISVFGASYVVIRKGAIDRWKTRLELERLAVTDFLTGILNRREIFARLDREMALMLRKREKGEGASIAILMLDIDNFKSINDTFGHLAGDNVLREVSDRVARAMRRYDSFGRYGGEEFLLVLPSTTLEEAAVVGERVRLLVSDTPLDVDDDELDVTVTIGISCVEPDEYDYEPALRRADDALLEGKREGKNRVTLAV